MTIARRGIFRLLGMGAAAAAVPKLPAAPLRVGLTARMLTTGQIAALDATKLTASNIVVGSITATQIGGGVITTAQLGSSVVPPTTLRVPMPAGAKPVPPLPTARLALATALPAIGVSWSCPDGVALDDIA